MYCKNMENTEGKQIYVICVCVCVYVTDENPNFFPVDISIVFPCVHVCFI